ncbi:MAG: FlxA-like family protein [Lachnospiraceae bacterium]|nr:FlxA-like family protein [Lachnospiraceae bacterium]
MVISGLGGTNAQMSPIGQAQANDPVAKDLQRQINDAQKQMQELASNKEMSAEDKMKKRQELQQKVSDLNMQLRQHQIDKRKEKQQEKASSDDVFNPNGKSNQAQAKTGAQNTGLSQSSMEAMISADVTVKQANTQGSVATKMNDRAGVLEVEIKLDSARGNDIGSKQAELADVKQKAEEATSAQLGTLAKASETLKEAAKAENNDADAKKDGEDSNKTDAENADSTAVKSGEDAQESSDNKGLSSDAVGNETNGVSAAIHYTPVDVRL